MKFKGTKGKWEVGTVNNAEYGINGLVVWSPEHSQRSDGTYEMVCHITTPEEQTETDVPNALLISKAPEMLEMLIRTVNLLKDIDSTLFHHNHSINGWHLNGDFEPIMNFVSEMDIDAISDADQLIKEATEL